MRLPRPSFPMALAAAALASACADAPDPIAPGSPQDPELALAANTAGLAPFTLGYLTSAHPRSPCTAAPHREFDFWLGAWNVEHPTGFHIGTNLVRSRADGCIVEENWVGAGGGAGRSINVFDAETGLWNQTWVSAFAPGHLRMAGGLDADGHMVLEGRRVTVAGTLFLDRYEWTPLDGGRVRQDGRLEVPSENIVSTFAGIYVPAATIDPAPLFSPGHCQPGGISEVSRTFDFAVGGWSVETHGKAIAASTIDVDLDGCLFEEVFTTPKGYEAVAFTYYDWREARWYRTWADSEGEWMQLGGGFEDGALVLTGTEAGRGASGTELLARVVWTPQDDGSIEVAHATSSDGGVSWHEELVLSYVR